MNQINPLLGRSAPALTPIRAGGATGRVGSFGPTRKNSDGSPHQHNGTDLLAMIGWPVFAAHKGLVTVAGWENDANPLQGYGRRVKIEATEEGRIRTVYAHLSLITVKPMDFVLPGSLIGLAGRSGNVGTDDAIPTHLHFEVHRGDGPGTWTPIDPELWIMGAL